MGYPNPNQPSFGFTALVNIIAQATTDAKTELNLIQQRKSAVSIADMFTMQMLMNHLSQMSEMSTAIINAANSATVSMARNIKG